MIIIIGFILTIFLVLFDQFTKWIIATSIGINNPIILIPQILQIRGVYNTGAAFSMLNTHTILLAIISFIAFLGITYLMKDFSLKRRPLYSIALILIYSGTIGNMIDRMFNNNGVFDFIEVLFVQFAVFNIADSYLTIGVILMGIYLIFFDKLDPISLKFKKKEFFDKFHLKDNTHE